MFIESVLKETVIRDPAITIKTIVIFCSHMRHSQGLEWRSRLLLKVPLKDKRYYGIFFRTERRKDPFGVMSTAYRPCRRCDIVPCIWSTSGGWLHQTACSAKRRVASEQDGS